MTAILLACVLSAGASAPESSATPPRSALFEQLIGTWDVRYEYIDKDGATRSDPGQVHYEWILDGHAVQETWTAKSANENLRPFGTTIDFYDPKRKQWTAVWVYPEQGATTIMTGGEVNGRFVLTGRNESGGLERWSTSVVGPDSIVIRAETMRDDGKSWRPLGVSYLQRREERSHESDGSARVQRSMPASFERYAKVLNGEIKVSNASDSRSSSLATTLFRGTISRKMTSGTCADSTSRFTSTPLPRLAGFSMHWRTEVRSIRR